MAIEVATLVTRLEAQTADHDRRLKTSERAIGDFSKAGDAASKKGDGFFSGFLGGAAKVGLAFTGISAGFGFVSGAIGAAIGPVADFDRQMAQIRATSGATEPQLAQLRNTALQLGMATDVGNVSASDGAAAIFELGKAGISTEAIVGGVAKSVLQLAAAAGPEFGVANAAALAAKALNTFKLDASQSTAVVNTLVGASNASSIGLSELKQGFSDVGAVAASMGLSIEDTSAALAILGDNGLSAGTAGGALKTMLLNLQPATKAQVELFRDLGIVTKNGANQFFDAKGKVKDLAGISGVLTKALAGMTDQQRAATLETMFGSEAITAANVLYGTGAEGVTKFIGKMREQGDAAKVAADMSNNLAGKWEAFLGTVQTGAIVLGTLFLPVLGMVTEGLNGLVGGALTWLSDPATAAGFGVVGDALRTGFGAAWGFITGAVQSAMPIVQGIFDYLTSTSVVSALGAIADALRVGLAGAWDVVSGVASAAWNGVLKPIFDWLGSSGVQAKIGEIGKAIGTGLGGALTFLKEHTTELAIAIGAVLIPKLVSLGVAAVQAGAKAAIAWGPWLIAIAAVTAAVILFKTGWDNNFMGMRDTLTRWWGTLGPIFENVKKWLGQTLADAWQVLGAAASAVWNNVLLPIWNYLSSSEVTSTILNVASALRDVLGAAFQFIGDHAGAIAVVIAATLIPAFAAWAISAGTAAAATLLAFAPIVLGIAAVGLAAAALKLAWDTNFLGIQQAVENIGPIIGNVFQFLVDHAGALAIAITVALVPAFVAWAAAAATTAAAAIAGAVATAVAFAPVVVAIMAVIAAAVLLQEAWNWAAGLFKSDADKMAEAAAQAGSSISSSIGVSAAESKAAADALMGGVINSVSAGVADISAAMKEIAPVELTVTALDGTAFTKAVAGAGPPPTVVMSVDVRDLTKDQVDRSIKAANIEPLVYQTEMGLLTKAQYAAWMARAITTTTPVPIPSNLKDLPPEDLAEAIKKGQAAFDLKKLNLGISIVPPTQGDIEQSAKDLVDRYKNMGGNPYNLPVPVVPTPKVDETGPGSFLEGVKTWVDGTVKTMPTVSVVVPVTVTANVGDGGAGGGSALPGAYGSSGLSRSQLMGVGLQGRIRQMVLSQVANMAPIDVKVPVNVQVDTSMGTAAGKGIDMAVAGLKGAVGGGGKGEKISAPDTSAYTGAIASLVASTKAQLASMVTVMGASGKAAVAVLAVMIISGLGSVVAAANSVGTGAVTTIRNTFSAGVLRAIALSAMLAFASGVASGGGVARANAAVAGANVRAAVAAPLAPGQFVGIGMNIGRGLAQGIAASTGAAVAAARSMAVSVAAAARTELAIKSPSKIFEEIGKQTNAGMAAGMAQNGGVLAATEAAMGQVIALAQRVVGKGTKELMEAFSSITSAVGGAFDLTSKIGGAQKDFVAPTRKFLDKAFASIDDILVRAHSEISKRSGMLTKANAELAGFMGDIFDGFSGAFDLLNKLGAKDAHMPLAINVKRFFTILDVFLVQLQQALASWKGKFDAASAELADVIGSSVSSILDTVDGFAELGKPDIVLAGKHGISMLFDSLFQMVPMLQEALASWKGKFKEGTVQLAEDVSSIVNSILDTVGGFADLGDPKNVMPGRYAIDSLFASLDMLIPQVKELLTTWKGKFKEGTVELSNAISDTVSNVLSTVDGLARLGDPKNTMASRHAIDALFNSLFYLIPQIQEFLERWKYEFNQSHADLSKVIGDAVNGVLSAVSGLAALGKPDVLIAGYSGINALFTGLDLILTQFEAAYEDWQAKFRAGTEEMAADIGQLANGVLAAVSGLAALGKEGVVMPGFGAIDALFNSLFMLITQFQASTAAWELLAASGNTTLAETVGKIAGGVLSALSGLVALGKADVTLPGYSAIDQLFSSLYMMLTQFDEVKAEWGNKFIEAHGDLAVTVGKIASGVLAAVSGLVALGKPDLVFPAKAAVTALFVSLGLVITAFDGEQAKWITKFNDMSVGLSDTMMKVVNNVTGALAGLLRLSDPKITYAGPVAVKAFFDNLTVFIVAFSDESVKWKDKATEKAAELAGYVGGIVGDIGKALDPILKMKDVQAITGGQIEGAMANVWFALDQFNRVMTGGSNGTPFQGEWMARATEFAKSIGTIFTELQRALGVISDTAKVGDGAGVGALLGNIQALWGTVFGPATLDGTLLHAIFGKPNGMFNWMDQNIPLYMGFTAGVWKQALHQLQESISANLAEMKLGLYNDAYEVGLAIAQGIADGSGGMTGVPTQSGGGGGNTPPVYAPPTPQAIGGGGQGLTFAYEGGGGGSGSGGKGQGQTIINNPIYIDGAQVSDPDTHRILADIATHKGMTRR